MSPKTSLILTLTCFTVYFFLADRGDPTPTSEERGGTAGAEQSTERSPRDLKSNRLESAVRVIDELSVIDDAFSRDEEASTAKRTPKSANHKSSEAQTKIALQTVLGIKQEASREVQDETQGDEKREKILFAADREGIKSAVQDISNEIKECYEGWLKQNDELQGQIQVSFVIDHAEGTIDESGQSREVLVAVLSDVYLTVDQIKHPMMSGCLINLIEDLHFENVPSQMTVRYPFQFSAKH